MPLVLNVKMTDRITTFLTILGITVSSTGRYGWLNNDDVYCADVDNTLIALFGIAVCPTYESVVLSGMV